MSDLTQAIAAFLAAKKQAKDYRTALSDWVRFLGGEYIFEVEEKFRKATRYEAQCFLEIIQKRPGVIVGDKPSSLNRASGATVSKKIYILRAIYSALQAESVVTHNPFALINPPSAEHNRKQFTKYVPFEKAKEMLDSCPIETQKGRRDKAILAVLLGGGLRRMEAVKLRLCDVMVSEKGTPYLVLRTTKSGKDSRQAIPVWAFECVQDWMNDRRNAGGKPEEPLFVSFTGRKIKEHKLTFSDKTVSRIVKRACEKVGLDPKDYSPHSLRATYGSRLDAAAAPLQDIQRAMRHASPNTTIKYLVSKDVIEDNVGKEIDF
jgi:site-specific recombinase XerD